MPLYMRQFSYTPETWAALAQHPENREVATRAAAEQFGCRLVFFAYTFGDYDGVAIFEAPDEATVSALLLASVLTGANRSTKTTALISAEAMVDLLRTSASVPLRVPGR
jgi:uncharacterized protein with GYD domain